MKRLFTFAVALVALLFAACEPEGTTPLDSKLTRTSAAIMEFNAAGGAGEITYTIENPSNGTQVIARCDAEWIDGLTSSDTKVTFTVDANTTGQSRLTTIAVTYGSNCRFEVTVSQSATGGNTSGGNNNGEWYCYCEYFGTLYSDIPNYYLCFSTMPVDADGYIDEAAEVYMFDLYSNANVSSPIVIPNGTYTYDANSTCANNTFGNEYSCWYPANAEAIEFNGGVVKVSNNKVEVNVTTADGTTHNFVYEGSLVCDDLSTEEGGDDDGNDDGGSNDDDYYYAYSNLTEDYSFNIAGGNAYGYIDFCGDYYGIGVNNFYLDLYEDEENSNGLNIILDLLTNATSTNFVGTYTPYDSSSSDEYTFVEGYPDEEGYLLGSWIATLANGELADGPLAPITLGSVTIATTNEANVYTVTLDCEDDLGYKISGTYKGELEYCDMSEEYSVAPKKANKKGVNITKKAVRKMSKKLHIARR